MQLPKLILLFPVLLICQIQESQCIIDPISIAIGGGLIYGATWLFSNNNEGKPGKVKKFIGQKTGYYEGCEDYWITGNIQALETDLKANIFGQPAALDIVISAIRKHLDGHSNRALMLSFHGSPGTGKNFVSSKILQQMFRNGENSVYQHTFRSSIDFPSQDKDAVYSYKRTVINKIKEMVYECHRSVIVFDEVEKMPAGILDTLSGFVKYGKNGDYDYRKLIFVLLSNSGSKLIFDEALHNWKMSHRRDGMDITGLNKRLAQDVFNEEGGFYRTGLIRNHGVSHFVPFLPLERHHIIQCLENEVEKQGQKISNELIEQVLQELTFLPREIGAFSYSGCKGVGEIAATLIEREKRRQFKSGRKIS